MEYTNAQILAAVLSEWARPAISQIATNKLLSIDPMKSLQQTIINSGLVGKNYSLGAEIMPFANSIIESLIEPTLELYLSKMDDKSLPQLAHSIVNTAVEQPQFSILDGLVEFEQSDMLELKDLLDKNLPLGDAIERYSVIH